MYDGFHILKLPSDAGFIGNLTHIIGLSCRQVRQAERYNWAATRGVNEEILLENLPEDLQRDIRRHLCKFLKKVSIKMSELNMTSFLDEYCMFINYTYNKSCSLDP